MYVREKDQDGLGVLDQYHVCARGGDEKIGCTGALLCLSKG